MIDLYLRADSEQQTIDLLTQAGILTETEGELSLASGVAYDPIGTIYEPGTYDEDGEEITAPVALEGWHVNVRVVSITDEQMAILAPITLSKPTNPTRIFG